MHMDTFSHGSYVIVHAPKQMCYKARCALRACNTRFPEQRTDTRPLRIVLIFSAQRCKMHMDTFSHGSYVIVHAPKRMCFMARFSLRACNTRFPEPMTDTHLLHSVLIFSPRDARCTLKPCLMDRLWSFMPSSWFIQQSTAGIVWSAFEYYVESKQERHWWENKIEKEKDRERKTEREKQKEKNRKRKTERERQKEINNQEMPGNLVGS